LIEIGCVPEPIFGQMIQSPPFAPNCAILAIGIP
jgi:hypothetical protein